MKNRINVGLCRGRHEMPVTNYIFESIPDVMDFRGLSNTVYDWIKKNVNVQYSSAVPVNGAEDAYCYNADTVINLYVTGLTSATATVIKACALNGIHLNLMHYDRENGEYKRQAMF